MEESREIKVESLFENIDWRQYWVDMQKYRDKIGNSDVWDAKAPSFASRKVSSYSQTFFEYLNIQEDETVLDMGCGTGEISVMLSKVCREVFSCDFSDGMLGYLKQRIEDESIENIHPKHMAWDDDWEANGIGPKSVDVAIASRSIMVTDLGATLEKLSRTARKRVAVTLAAGCSPTEIPELLEAIGRKPQPQLDPYFCVNMLFQMGYMPELRYIKPDKVKRHATPEEARIYAINHIKNPTEEEKQIAIRYVDEHLEKHAEEDPDEPYRLDHAIRSTWAFVTWEV